MPTFNFADDFSSLEKRVYMQAARAACRWLDVDKIDASIYIMRGHLGGQTNGAMTCIAPHDFLILLDESIDPPAMIHALGHELIHFAQHERGDLGTGQQQDVIWKGRSYPVVQYQRDGIAAYLDQPWEKEAFAKHDDLFKAVVVQLASEDRTMLIREDSIRDLKAALGSLLHAKQVA